MHEWGFDALIDIREINHFHEGEYAPRRDREHAPVGGNPADEIAKVKVIADPDAPPLLIDAGMITEKYRHPISYCKGAVGMALLREQIIGPERFDRALGRYNATRAASSPLRPTLPA